MPKFTPFEELQQFVGPSGPGSKKPCTRVTEPLLLLSCDLCRGTGYYLDTEAPLFKAMWNEGHTNFDDPPSTPPQWGWLHRSRAEAALLLLDVARLQYGVTLTMYMFGECRAELHAVRRAGQADNPIDALCAALLKKVANA